MPKYYLQWGDDRGIVAADTMDAAILQFLRSTHRRQPRQTVPSVIGLSQRGYDDLKYWSIGPFIGRFDGPDGSTQS